MNIPTGVSAMLQVVAALLIFVASYLALVVCAIACLAVAELFSKRADVAQQYGAKPTPIGTANLSPVDDLSQEPRLAYRRQIPRRI